MIGRGLNHSQPSATAAYARLDLEPVRRALETNAQAMLEAERSPAAEIARMRRERLTKVVDQPIGASPRGSAASNPRGRTGSLVRHLAASQHPTEHLPLGKAARKVAFSVA